MPSLVRELKSVQSFRWVLVAAVAAIAALGGSVADAAVVQSVQTGTVVVTANGIVTVPITAVTMNRTALFFDSSHDSDRPTSSAVRGRLATTTTLEFEKVTNEAAPTPITIRWYVVQWTSGVLVQRGVVT